MRFTLDDDQRALQEAVRDLVRGRATSERIRAAASTGGVDRGLVGELAHTGVFALALPESAGGLGLAATHAAVVFEELGAGIVPGPLVATFLAAGTVDGAAGGTTVVTEAERSATVATHLDGADLAVVVDDDGLWAVAPDEVERRPADRPLDPISPVAAVDAWPQGARLTGADAAVDWRRRRTLLTAAALVGLAARATAMSVQHATDRRQFGRAIGSFQAIKHLCADALTRTEVARAAVHAAACGLAGRGDDRDLDVALAGAAALAIEAAERNGKTCIQVHGGMGFTWEVDAHLVLKRALVLAASIGGADRHDARVAAAL